MDWWKKLLRPYHEMRYPDLGFTFYEPKADSEAGRKLEALRASIREKFPNFQIPDIFVVQNPHKLNLALTSDEELERRGGRPNTIFPSYNAAYLLGAGTWPTGVPRGVFIDHNLVRILSPEELTSVIAHEYGHAYIDEHGGKKENPRNPSLSQWYKESQKNECRADHFAAHVMPEAVRHLPSALIKIRQASGEKETEVEPHYSTHPMDEARLRGQGTLEAIKLRPGDVKLDHQCNADLSEVLETPPPATPGMDAGRFSVPIKERMTRE